MAPFVRDRDSKTTTNDDKQFAVRSVLYEFLLVNLLLVHSFHMPCDVHLLLCSIDTMGTLELGLFATFPFLMVS